MHTQGMQAAAKQTTESTLDRIKHIAATIPNCASRLLLILLVSRLTLNNIRVKWLL